MLLFGKFSHVSVIGMYGTIIKWALFFPLRIIYLSYQLNRKNEIFYVREKSINVRPNFVQKC